jgi:TPR repeat protein
MVVQTDSRHSIAVGKTSRTHHIYRQCRCSESVCQRRRGSRHSRKLLASNAWHLDIGKQNGDAGVTAERGLRAAQLRWGLALMEGRDVEQDLVLGESWLRRATLAGDPDAAALVGDLYVKNGRLPPNYTEAAGWYRRAAEAGHTAAARALGSLYLTGAGVAADPDEAARWLRVSGEAGDPASQVDLANLVLDGAGSAEDRGRVAHWFEQAAAAGDLVAAFNLGLCLDKGVGVEPDAQQAVH